MIPPPPGDPPRPPPPPCPIPLPADGRVPDAHVQLQPSLGPPLLHTLPLPPAQPLPEGRDAKGRFAPGNPGKQPGTRHRVTVAMESLMEGQWEGLTKTVVALALRGDTTALRLCFDRIAPVRRGSHVEIPDFPKLDSPGDVPKAHAAILSAIAAGHLTAEEAKPLSDLLGAYIAAVDVTTFAERLTDLEKQIEESRQRGPR